MTDNLLLNHSSDRLARIDRNLAVLRDKIDDAERVTGQTRSNLLTMLSPDDKDKSKALDLLSDQKVKTENIDENDLLSLQKLLDRINFQLLGLPNRKRRKGETLLVA